MPLGSRHLLAAHAPQPQGSKLRLATLILLLGYLAISAIGGSPISSHHWHRGTETRVKVDLKTLQAAAIFYEAEMGVLPTGWSDLTDAKPEPFLEMVPLDPWGEEYRYFLAEDGGSAMIGTYCRDNEPGGEGEDEDRFVVFVAKQGRTSSAAD